MMKSRNIVRSLTAIAVIGAFAAPVSAQQVTFMTGPQGGSWIPLGGQLKDMWEKAIPGLQVQVLPGAGIANARGVDEGKADIGFGNSISTVDGINGKKPFPKKLTNVCNIATLYPQYYQLVVLADAGVNSIKDLKGKAVTTQQRGNTTWLTWSAICCSTAAAALSTSLAVFPRTGLNPAKASKSKTLP